MGDRDMIHTLRDQMSSLCGVFALSMMLFDRVEDDEILKLAASAVPTLGPCRVEGIYLRGDEPPRHGDLGTALRTHLSALGGADGEVRIAGRAWAWGYPLRGLGGHRGYLVVSAAAPPSYDEQFLVRTLTQQAGAALNSAALYRGERAASEELRERNAQLASVNQDLERRTEIHASLMNVAAAGGGEAEIAATLSRLTGMDAVVEDKFGNALAETGRQRPTQSPSRPPVAANRTELLNRIRRDGRSMRHRGRILALAQSRGEVLGVLALVDPHRETGQLELFALEGAAVVLATELAHQRSLAENELRLRGDLVDDLLNGADDASAQARSAALGHDLHPLHQVLVISWPGTDNEEKLARAVDQATSRLTQSRALLTRRDGKIVLIAPSRASDGTELDWKELHRLVSGALPRPGGAVGVGRECAHPSELARSYNEALRALGVRQTSAEPSGVTPFEDLGFYRMLGSEESLREVGEFVREWLGPLIDYDTTHRCDLVSTLSAYYECGGNYDATAEVLMIHRSTLRYRLRRIRELTGHDIGKVDTRLNLHIATRAWQIQVAGPHNYAPPPERCPT